MSYKKAEKLAEENGGEIVWEMDGAHFKGLSGSIENQCRKLIATEDRAEHDAYVARQEAEEMGWSKMWIILGGAETWQEFFEEIEASPEEYPWLSLKKKVDEFYATNLTKWICLMRQAKPQIVYLNIRGNCCSWTFDSRKVENEYAGDAAYGVEGPNSVD